MLTTLLNFYSICICMHVINAKKHTFSLFEFMNPQVKIKQPLSIKYFV